MPREAAHALFGRYRQWLAESVQFDLNLIARDWLALAQPLYDFIVIDEMQDLTGVQLALLLAHAEVDSSYTPARKLWARTRNGHYLLNAGMLLRKGEDWVPVYDALRLNWIDRGTGTDESYRLGPMARVQRLHARLLGQELEHF